MATATKYFRDCPHIANVGGKFAPVEKYSREPHYGSQAGGLTEADIELILEKLMATEHYRFIQELMEKQHGKASGAQPEPVAAESYSNAEVAQVARYAARLAEQGKYCNYAELAERMDREGFSRKAEASPYTLQAQHEAWRRKAAGR